MSIRLARLREEQNVKQSEMTNFIQSSASISHNQHIPTQSAVEKRRVLNHPYE